MNKFLLKLNLQFFSEEGAVTGGAADTSTETAAEPQTPVTPETPQNGGLSNDELKAVTEGEILKSLGVNSIDELKQTVEQHRAYVDSQKSEAQKQAEQFEQAQQALQAKDGEIFNLTAKLAAVSHGVQADALDDVITLAKGLTSDKVDINAAIGQVIEKYPHFAQQQAPSVPKFSTGKSGTQEPTELDKWLNAFK